MGPSDVIVLDKLVHACIVDAARLSGAKLRVFAHNEIADLEGILRWAAARSPRPRTLIVTESVFSMDGDHAPLRDIVRLKEQYGAWLMVDEAHATGLYGPSRRGLAEELGVSDAIEIQMGTLGKALGASGGYICGSRALIDYLVNRARSFIFSTAPVPAAAAAATAGIRFVQSSAGEERRNALWQRVGELSAASPPSAMPGAIIPLMLGDEARAVAAAAALRERGIFIPAIRYPTVARGQARLRLTLTASHTPADLAELLSALRSMGFGLRDFGLRTSPSCILSLTWTTATSGIPSRRCATGSSTSLSLSWKATALCCATRMAASISTPTPPSGPTCTGTTIPGSTPPSSVSCARSPTAPPWASPMNPPRCWPKNWSRRRRRPACAPHCARSSSPTTVPPPWKWRSSSPTNSLAAQASVASRSSSPCRVPTTATRLAR